MTSKEFNQLSFDEVRKLIGGYLHTPEGGKLWDLMAVVRGPDYPSERPNMDRKTSAEMYRGRRNRKAETGEVLRSKLFGGKIGGSARSRTDIDYVTLPPRSEWDHYDRHVERAAQIMGLEVRIKDEIKGVRVELKSINGSAERTPQQMEALNAEFEKQFPDSKSSHSMIINGVAYLVQAGVKPTKWWVSVNGLWHDIVVKEPTPEVEEVEEEEFEDDF